MVVGGEEKACPAVTSSVPLKSMLVTGRPSNESVTVLESKLGAAWAAVANPSAAATMDKRSVVDDIA
jgi:hypothetical protein